MAEIILVSNKTNAVIDSIESFYTATSANNEGLGTRVNAFTASNDTTSSIDYKAYIFDASGALVSPVIPQTTVVRDRFDLGAPIVGQLIPPGGQLMIESSGALSFYVTGDEL